jgi:hypothetical protein
MTNALKAELGSMRFSRAVILAGLIPAVIVGFVVLVDHQAKLTGSTSTGRSNGRC